ncbi:hypothetical protein HN014_19705 [Aquimarina sp. TRL1]|uniref:M949_RS01915 family surface polysaccharide biosynthesis protein n=1 Tax=Aquimarina sp. (strain TRL1) TaxID=2736252 RepID=UPI00158D5538|nr:hypothetical protein [Aquimarina sp. TRL1]QKX07043.1 hypothetical protein HN014_19705 [Aquimarina sp. TRL1]
MKHIYFLICLLCTSVFSQTVIQEDMLQPYLHIPILDEVHSESSLKLKKIGYDEIPLHIEFRGTLLEAVAWEDKEGAHILLFSKTGTFAYKAYEDISKTRYTFQDKAALYVYMFTKTKGDDTYKRQWRVYDYAKNYGVDMYVGFIKKATTITDVDQDGTVEVSIPYRLIVRGGIDPGVMKIIVYEGTNKYALRGETAICLTKKKQETQEFGGTFKADKKIQQHKKLFKFLTERWEQHKCEAF